MPFFKWNIFKYVTGTISVSQYRSIAAFIGSISATKNSMAYFSTRSIMILKGKKKAIINVKIKFLISLLISVSFKYLKRFRKNSIFDNILPNFQYFSILEILLKLRLLRRDSIYNHKCAFEFFISLLLHFYLHNHMP